MRRCFLHAVLLSAVLLLTIIKVSQGETVRVCGPGHGRCESCHIGGDPTDQSTTEPANALWAPAGAQRTSSFTGDEPSSSKRCLSCHDATIARDAADSLGERGAPVDLNRGHPVSVDYDSATNKKGRRLIPSVALRSLKLFKGKVECASCHDIHGPRRLRTASKDLCTGCHTM